MNGKKAKRARRIERAQKRQAEFDALSPSDQQQRKHVNRADYITNRSLDEPWQRLVVGK